jgi:hypothetical protein
VSFGHIDSLGALNTNSAFLISIADIYFWVQR